ncbi:hypothetical protein BDV38DRAFT_69537 [Aspergillus pseudotamarii]|uniref:Uncharacterized protein n=1 Tax=Aspergillus pseudotamarii TaxID=132259 RepID=A0A5N6SUM7_ASPPS|nr:uncharacterized protein BDV38DRAFT_69537 [Aspergillus pseudotamarii]KAE8138322.1 hypothetical protein BDV38DRAFT_69537 [Aspergillus pseudotamarii]
MLFGSAFRPKETNKNYTRRYILLPKARFDQGRRTKLVPYSQQTSCSGECLLHDCRSGLSGQFFLCRRLGICGNLRPGIVDRILVLILVWEVDRQDETPYRCGLRTRWSDAY